MSNPHNKMSLDKDMERVENAVDDLNKRVIPDLYDLINKVNNKVTLALATWGLTLAALMFIIGKLFDMASKLPK